MCCKILFYSIIFDRISYTDKKIIPLLFFSYKIFFNEDKIYIYYSKFFNEYWFIREKNIIRG